MQIASLPALPDGDYLVARVGVSVRVPPAAAVGVGVALEALGAVAW